MGSLPFNEKMAPKKAEKLAETMIEHGVVVQRVPGNMITRTILYSELSDMIDATIALVLKNDAQIFDSNLASNVVTPGQLKAYLYAIAMFHFQLCGCLVIAAGGSMPPQCAGFYVPNCFLAMLQYLGEYSESGCVGRVRYITPTTVPVLSTDGITNGTAVETNLSLSTPGLSVPVYTLNGAQQEYLGVFSTANTTDYITNINQNGEKISRVLQTMGLPTSPMWERPPIVPDGSAWTFPCDGYNEATSGGGSSALLWVNPFKEWDEEVGVLFWTLVTAYTTNNIHSVLHSPRLGPIAIECPSQGYGGAGSGYDEAYFARKLSFCQIVSGVDYEPGMSTKELRSWFGEPLKTFRTCPIAICLRGWHENIGVAALQIAENSGVWDTTGIFALMLVAEHLCLRKIQISNPYLQADYANAYKNILPRGIETLTAIISLAQLLAELGPVVKDGMLHCPVPPTSASNSDSWYGVWSTFGTQSVTFRQFNFGLINAGTGSALTWSGVTLNGAWVTAYNALANPLKVSWVAVYAAHRQQAKYLAQGAIYGKGEFAFSVGFTPRGGKSMFVRNWQSGASGSQTNMVADGQEQSTTLVSYPLIGLYSCAPVDGPDIALAAIARWVTGFQTSGGTSVDIANTYKYAKQWNSEGSNPHVHRFHQEALSPGGAVIDQLSKAFIRRHEGMEMFDGVSTAMDDPNACLWDSFKGLVGTVANSLQPAVSRGAGIGCGLVPVVGQFLKPACQEVAKSLIGHIADNSTVSTNRHVATSTTKEFEHFRSTVVKAEPVEWNQISSDRAAFYEPKTALKKKKNGKVKQVVQQGKKPAAKKKPVAKPKSGAKPKSVVKKKK